MPLKEKQLIERIRSTAHARFRAVSIGIGDDCAVLDVPHGHELLVTTDFSLEGVHFLRRWHPPAAVGHRCLARGLSDIAAMGGWPHSAFLSLALPPDLPQRWVDGFLKGLLELAARFSVALAGGDTAQSPGGILADIVVLGSAPKGSAVLRSGARPGDAIYVTGTLGASCGALALLRNGKKLRPRSHPRHFYPEPRLAVGRWLREKKLASAMIDTSDGLSTDLRHICDESGAGAVVYRESLPRVPADKDLSMALHGGEDYELLFTTPSSRRVPAVIADVRISRIGEITRGHSIGLADASGRLTELKPAGWEHFS